MLKFCSSARNGYRSYLEEKKSSKKIKKGGESQKEMKGMWLFLKKSTTNLMPSRNASIRMEMS